jgi:hypothetical protein
MLYVYFKTMAAHFFVIHGNRYSGMREQVSGTRDRMFLVLTPRDDTTHKTHAPKRDEAHRKSPVRLDASRGRRNNGTIPTLRNAVAHELDELIWIDLVVPVGINLLDQCLGVRLCHLLPRDDLHRKLELPRLQESVARRVVPWAHGKGQRWSAGARVCDSVSLSRARTRDEQRRDAQGGWSGMGGGQHNAR